MKEGDEQRRNRCGAAFNEESQASLAYSQTLETAFYLSATTIAQAALALLGRHTSVFEDIDREDNFKGPYQPSVCVPGILGRAA